jgi:hypothetical protein
VGPGAADWSGAVVRVEDYDHRDQMHITEFREKGYLQEANRLFFHPLGMSLGTLGPSGQEALGLWDFREDPEGVFFTDLSTTDAVAKAEYVQEQTQDKGEVRVIKHGWFHQPVKEPLDSEDEVS